MVYQLLYNWVAMPAFHVGLHLTARWDRKVRQAIDGRRDVWQQLDRQLQAARERPRTVWFHCTSVGEFEQARPLVDALYPDTRIVLTYFSPSVAPNVERYDRADVRCYLPFDTRRNAQHFVAKVSPDMLLFSKFDIWPNYVWAAAKVEVPIVLIAGTLHAKSRRIAPLARPFFRRVHEVIQMHCVISEQDSARFAKLCNYSERIRVTGDTRFDRVYARAQAVPADERFIPGQETLRRPVLVAGSTYREEEEVLLDALQQILQREMRPTLVLVPHEPTQERVAQIRTLVERHRLQAAFFAALDAEADLSGADVLVVDTVGILAKLYRLGELAFVGGSFHGSVHNVMEPAAMARPLIFGPTIQNAYEATLLQERGAARQVHNSQELADVWYDWIQNPVEAASAGQTAKEVIEENLGAADATLVAIHELLGDT